MTRPAWQQPMVLEEQSSERSPSGLCDARAGHRRWAALCLVAGDSIYGVGEIETALRRAGKGYVLGVNATHPFGSWGDKPLLAGTAEAIARGLGDVAWQRLSAVSAELRK